MSNRFVGRSQRIYLQTPENGTLLLGLQVLTRVYVFETLQIFILQNRKQIDNCVGVFLIFFQDLTDNNNHPDVCIVQGHEVYILADGDGLTSSCDERNDLCPPVNQLEVRVIEGDSDHKSSAQDEELTSLSWLQNTNLLQSLLF